MGGLVPFQDRCLAACLLDPSLPIMIKNLEDKIRWCIANDSKCEQIAKNAKEFYDKYLKGMHLLLVEWEHQQI